MKNTCQNCAFFYSDKVKIGIGKCNKKNTIVNEMEFVKCTYSIGLFEPLEDETDKPLITNQLELFI